MRDRTWSLTVLAQVRERLKEKNKNRINTLNPHFQKHSKDHASRLGLLKLVGQRRRLLNFLKSQDETRYSQLLTKLELRK